MDTLVLVMLLMITTKLKARGKQIKGIKRSQPLHIKCRVRCIALVLELRARLGEEEEEKEEEEAADAEEALHRLDA